MISIVSINKINNFASFQDFKKSEYNYSDFKKYNLFYGLNGSGKTTISRIFDFLNKGMIPDKEEYSDFKNMEFEIELSDGINKFTINKLDKNILINKIRVFNADFVKNNMLLENASATALTYSMGEISIGLKTEITSLKKKQNARYKHNRNGEKVSLLSKKKQEYEDKLKSCYSDTASKIKNVLLSIPYTATNIKKDFSEIKTFNVLSEKELSEYSKIFNEKSKTALSLTFTVLKDSFLSKEQFDNIDKLLKKIVKRKSQLSESMINWIETGLDFHNETSPDCIFCGNPLPPLIWHNLLKKLQELVKKDNSFIMFEDDIRNNIQLIDDYTQIASNIYGGLRVEDFLGKYQDGAKTIINYISEKDLIKHYQDLLTSIRTKLEKKLLNIDEAGSLNDLTFSDDLSFNLGGLLTIISKNNKDISKIDADKKEAKEKVISHFCTLVKDKIDLYKSRIEYGNKLEPLINNKIEKIQQDIDKKERTLSNQNAPAEKIENLCERVFGYKKFNIKYENGSYKIIRPNSSSARNISEGEKTVIAFAYFIASLEEKDFDLKESVLVIDDPISSLDQQYLFNLNVLLSQKIRSYKDFQQVFIFTHNFYFFRKIRDFCANCADSYKYQKDQAECVKLEKDPKYQKQNIISPISIYEIRKDIFSRILDADKYIRTYQTEYLHLINYLKELYKKDNIEMYDDVAIGNCIRQVLEIFLSFKFPAEKTLFQRFSQISDNSKYKYLYGLSNAMSHTNETSSENVAQDYNFKCGKEEISELFLFIKNLDEAHAKSLKLP